MLFCSTFQLGVSFSQWKSFKTTINRIGPCLCIFNYIQGLDYLCIYNHVCTCTTRHQQASKSPQRDTSKHLDQLTPDLLLTRIFNFSQTVKTNVIVLINESSIQLECQIYFTIIFLRFMHSEPTAQQPISASHNILAFN